MNTTRRTFFPLLALVAIASSLSLGGCASSSGTTTGKRIVLKTKITAPQAVSGFSNSQGWNVTLSKLALSTGAFYYFDGATIFSSLSPRERRAPHERVPTRVVDRLLGIKTAHAHPGHYIPGEARGQMLTPASVELHAGPADLPVGDGVTGVVRSGTFSFGAPAAGAFASELGTHVVIVEGTATKGADTRPFRAEVDATELYNTQNKPAIEGCTFTETTMENDGTVTLTVKPALWFDQVEFETIAASTDGKPVLMKTEDLARKELVRGLKAGDAYIFSYAP